MAVSVATADELRTSKGSTRASDRIFYSVGAWLCAAAVLAGFSPTFFLAPLFARPFPPPLLILHGTLLTAWFTLYVAQTTLIRVGRPQTHRRLGRVGAVLAIPVVGVLGVVLFTATARNAARMPLEVLTSQVINAILLVLVIVASIALAVWKRHDAAAHKRLMWPSAVMLQTAGLGRLVALLGVPWLSLPIIVLMGISNVVYDVVTLRRVHWASICGAALVLVPVALNALGNTVGRIPLAQEFAAWVFL
jgi:hypothetical protein